ncbi:MAG: S-layer homology domain-containing protein [bacterium]|nr:S-layer homology domain-containing protein [bacterium]
MLEAAGLRNRWTFSASALLLAGSLLFGSVPPAGGVDGVVDHRAGQSACVAAAAESAGFEDMVGNFAEEAANCLAHYGITYGKTPERFSPRDIIPRWQMALFLQRAAVPAGIVLPGPADQGYTDLGSFASHIQAGINQMAASGIMPGTTDTTYRPSEPVTRKEMALLLARFLAAAATGPGGTDIDTVRPDDSNFKDLSQVSFTANQAIRRLYEMGVTQGTTATTFSPEGWVTRGQMAVFITRMLAHTNARPVGVSAQVTEDLVFRDSPVEIAISLRDTRHQPLVNRSVDLFTTDHPTMVFSDKGTCTAEARPAVGARECVIDGTDPATDMSGNLRAGVGGEDAERLRVWMWTGNRDEVFNEDTTQYATIDIATLASPTALMVTDSLPSSAVKVPFGEAVTFTFQLVDNDGLPVPREGVRFVLEVQESRTSGTQLERTTLTKTTGPDGSARQTFLHVDPFAEPGDVAFLDLDVRTSGGLAVRDGTAVGIVDDDGSRDDATLEWSDDRAEPTTLELAVVREYIVASSAGSGAAATVHATLSDQYGGPVRGEQVVFSSNDSRGVPNGVRRTTNSRGVAGLNYQRDSAESFAERITGSFDRIRDTTRQYWVMRVSGAADGSGTVRVVDTDDDTTILVTNDERVLLIEYDSNDAFKIGPSPVSYSDFEDDLTVGDTLRYAITNQRSATVNSFTLGNR